MTPLTLHRRPLERFFSPASIAVIGATETDPSVGRTILTNLASFHGRVLPVIRSESRSWVRTPILPSARFQIRWIGDHRHTRGNLAGIVAECAAAKVPAAIVISAGLKETGARGADLERKILAARGSMRIIGPNCLGVMAPLAGVNATFAGTIARPGSIGFLSQSGALCTAIRLESSRDGRIQRLCLHRFHARCGWGDLIDYLGDDPHTRAILMYME